MAGQTYSATDLNFRAGTVCQELYDKPRQAREWYLWLQDASHTDAILTIAPYNVALVDLTIIRAAAADLGGDAGLYATAKGTFHPVANNNFLFNAVKLTGLNWSGSAT